MCAIGFGQELERDRLVEREIVGAVDLAHAALAEHRDDAVPSAEQFAGSESALRPRWSAGTKTSGWEATLRAGRGVAAATVRVARNRPVR